MSRSGHPVRNAAGHRTRVGWLVRLAVGVSLAVAGVVAFVPPGAADQGPRAQPETSGTFVLVQAPEDLQLAFQPVTQHGDPNATTTLRLRLVYRVVPADQETAQRLVAERWRMAREACLRIARQWVFRDLLDRERMARAVSDLTDTVDMALFADARDREELAARVVHLHIVDATPVQPGPGMPQAMSQAEVQRQIEAAVQRARSELESK